MDGKVKFLVKLLFPINVSRNQILVFPFLKTGHSDYDCIFDGVVPVNGGGWIEANLKRLKQDFYRELPGSGGEISRLADITLIATTRERSARDSSSPVMAAAQCQVASKSPDI